MFAPNTATDSLQISLNTLASDSDEEHALKEELANEVRRTQLGNDDCYNPNMEGISYDDPPITEQTQRADKCPIKEPTSKGKKVAKKVDRASEMTMALQEYTALATERFSNKKRRSTGSSEHVAQSAGGGNPMLTSLRFSKRKRKGCYSWACQNIGGRGGWSAMLISQIINDDCFWYVFLLWFRCESFGCSF